MPHSAPRSLNTFKNSGDSKERTHPVIVPWLTLVLRDYKFSTGSFGYQFDSNTPKALTGTSPWIFPLDPGMKNGTTHTLSLGFSSGSSFLSLVTLTFKKGRNADFNGDGYPDLLIASYATNGATISGGAYVYHSTASATQPFPPSPSTTIVSPQVATSDFFGSNSAIGDLNGDGYADLAIGAWGGGRCRSSG